MIRGGEMASIPEKLKKGDPIRSTLFQRFNALIEYLRSSQVAGDNKTIAVNRTSSGTVIRAIGRSAAAAAAGDGLLYDGPFAVHFGEDDGIVDPSVLTVKAGFILCNGKLFECQAAELKTSTGFVCVHTSLDESAENGEVKIKTPEILISEKPDAEHFPIAQIIPDSAGDGFVIVSCFSPVAVFMFTAPCPVFEKNEKETNS